MSDGARIAEWIDVQVLQKMKTFYFSRLVTVEERFKVEMSDELGNEIVAKNILLRHIDKPTTVVQLIDSKVTKTGRFSSCK